MNDYAVAVLAGIFVALTLGFIWYSPSAFGEVFLEARARRGAELGDALRPIAGSIGALVVSALALAVVVQLSGASTVGDGARVGAAVGVVVAAAMLSDYLFSGWPLRLCAVQAGFRLIFLVLMGILLAAR